MKHTLHIAIALLALAGMSTVGFSQQKTDSETLRKNVKKLVTTGSKDAHNKSVFDMEVQVKSKWAEPAGDYDGISITNKPCSAVRIDRNWLMASLTCRGIGEYADWYDHNAVKHENGKKVEYRQILSATIRSSALHVPDKIEAKNIFVDEQSKIILMQIDPSNTKLVNEVASNEGVIAYLLIAKHPDFLQQTVKETYINRENFCLPGRCSARVRIDEYCSDSKCYRVHWEFINGDAGDPLIIVSDKVKGAEFLAGFNNAKISGIHGDVPESGTHYTAFDEVTQQAIKNIIKDKDPAAWERILKRTKNETEI